MHNSAARTCRECPRATGTVGPAPVGRTRSAERRCSGTFRHSLRVAGNVWIPKSGQNADSATASRSSASFEPSVKTSGRW
jgi:hypothetical protein